MQRSYGIRASVLIVAIICATILILANRREPQSIAVKVVPDTQPQTGHEKRDNVVPFGERANAA